MIVSINQPAYLPWLGYYHRIAISDIHIVLDHVQFEKNSFSNRNKVWTVNGCTWLTVPLKTKGRFGQLPLNEIEITDAPWARKHWSTLKQSYSKARFFSLYECAYAEYYSRSWSRLSDLTREMTSYQLECLDIHTPILFSSEMNSSGKKDELILNLCRAVGASVYLSGPLGRQYLHPELFDDAGIRIVYHDYRHPTYPQLNDEFQSGLATIDLFFNNGPESRHFLGQGNDELVNTLKTYHHPSL